MASKSPRVLRVAVVGVGEVALTTHLPTLLLMSHMFQVVALVDLSRTALKHASDKFHISPKRTYTKVQDMLADSEDVELVMVLSANEYHVEHAVFSLTAGKHVFIEKPMALTVVGAGEVEKAREDSGKVVFVGTMRRYATAFLRVKEMLREVGSDEITYVRVRDIIGKNDLFVAQCGSFPRKFDDVPAAAIADRKKLSETLMRKALGPRAANPKDVETFQLLASLSVHDLSAMRELIGMPKKVLSARTSPDRQFIWVMFDYESFVAYYEVGIDNVQIFDAHIEVYTRDKRIKVNYDTPYVKGLPITATILSTKENGDHSEEIIRPTYEDAFTLEYKALYAAIVEGAPVKTSPWDAAQDLLIFEMIMDALE